MSDVDVLTRDARRNCCIVAPSRGCADIQCTEDTQSSQIWFVSSSSWCLNLFEPQFCSLVGPAHTVHSGEPHQQSSRKGQEPPEGLETEEEEDEKLRVWFILRPPVHGLPSSLSPAQDRPSHQHLLQCSEAALAAGQRGRGTAGGAERARHVWHGGLLDHLGEWHTCERSFRTWEGCFAAVPLEKVRFLFPPVPDGGQRRGGPLYRRDKRQSHHALQHSHHGLGLWTLQVSNTQITVETLSPLSPSAAWPRWWPQLRVVPPLGLCQGHSHPRGSSPPPVTETLLWSSLASRYFPHALVRLNMSDQIFIVTLLLCFCCLQLLRRPQGNPSSNPKLLWNLWLLGEFSAETPHNETRSKITLI